MATDVTGTEGQRSVLARCGARYPTAGGGAGLMADNMRRDWRGRVGG